MRKVGVDCTAHLLAASRLGTSILLGPKKACESYET